MITSKGRHIQISEKRHCPKCGFLTEQVCHKIRYQENHEESRTLIKKSYWICPTCLNETEEVKNQLIPGDKVRIIDRMLRMQEDYAIRSMNISSFPEKLVIEIMLRD
jgi:rubredoxin